MQFATYIDFIFEQFADLQQPQYTVTLHERYNSTHSQYTFTVHIINSIGSEGSIWRPVQFNLKSKARVYKVTACTDRRTKFINNPNSSLRQ